MTGGPWQTGAIPNEYDKWDEWDQSLASLGQGVHLNPALAKAERKAVENGWFSSFNQ